MANTSKQDLASTEERISAACDAVATLFPTRVITQRSSPAAYIRIQSSYWNALQQQKTPACFFQPTSAEQVSAALVEVVRAKCPFSIKGGGHSSNSEGSSLGVRVGPGVRWGPLLQTLEKRCLSVVGGRDFGVGVPGFIFGGGLSYYSAEHGWGVDNLVSADIVLASGDLITVDSATHPELNKALHGGGAANFGIVTSLTLKVYPFHGMWGGLNAIDESHFQDVFDAYDKYTQDLGKDGKAHMIMDFFRKDGQMACALWMGHPKPDPAIFQRLANIPSLLNTLRVAEYSDLATEMAEQTDSQGKRNAYWTFSMEYDISLLRSVYDLFDQMSRGQYRFALDVNHITPAMRNKAAREGTGNVYGLEGPDEPLIIIMITAIWEDASDDLQIAARLKKIGAALEELARQHGKNRSFKYMNYAHQEQDVISGFGEENEAFLKQVAAKYDPAGVFQTLRQGPWKLEMAKPDASKL